MIPIKDKLKTIKGHDYKMSGNLFTYLNAETNLPIMISIPKR